MGQGVDGTAVEPLTLESTGGLAHAVVDPVGAALRSLVVEGTELVVDGGPHTSRPFFAGATLFPWPNRVRDGRWSDGGTEYALEINEPERNTALHGLVANQPFRVVGRTSDVIELEGELRESTGYPFSVSISVTYRLHDRGVDCDYLIVNQGTSTAPVALGAHPFLRLGEWDTRLLTIEAPIDEVVLVDERMLPIGLGPASDTAVDVSSPRLLETVSLDHAFRLAEGHDRRVRLTAPNGQRLELWMGPEFRWLQLFTTPDFPSPHGAVFAVAIEPMTAPPDALNSHTDIRWLTANGRMTARWGVELPAFSDAGGSLGY